MGRRKDAPLDDEQRSYGALWLVCSVLLFVGALWAVADDNIFRRPWKKYQAEFSRLEIHRLEEAIAAEQAKLDADPAYQAATRAVEEARARGASGETQRHLAALRAELDQAKRDDQSKDLNLRFVKSELEEWRYFYDDAHHHGRPTDEIQREIDRRVTIQAERERIYAESQAKIAALEAQIDEIEGVVERAEEERSALTTVRDELHQRLESISLGYFPGPKATPPFFGWGWQPKIPKIQQVVLPDFDRNNFDQLIARVDRCTSCHAGIDKAGFEDQPNPWKTHPRRDLYLAKHPPEKFGCTPCHLGEGEAVNTPRRAHGNFVDEHGHIEDVEFIERRMLRGEKMQANCIKCHDGVQHLPGAETLARGEWLFQELGCHGCHLTEGYEELAKDDGVSSIGPSLRRIAAKVEPAWLVRWVRNPHEFRPRTRMPNFMFDEQQAVAVSAWLLANTRAPSDEWLAAHPTVDADAALAERGRELVDSIGCRGCHALAPDEVAGQVGANKDVAPNLANVAEKTDGRWIYHWIKNPRGYSPIARMPSLRLSDGEAKAITAYLLTLGTRRAADEALLERLRAPENVAAGEKLVRKYGCAGCHDIPGMEQESRIGVELSSFGSKTKEELFFGDRTDLRENWDEWTYHKLKTPRTYETKWIEQLMPQFDLTDEDIKALRAFLASRTEGRVPPRYRYAAAGEAERVEGRRLVARYNCTGCHVVESAGGDIRRLYEEQPTLAPPNLFGEGRKVQSDWLFSFVKSPGTIRPWLRVRMPTFGLNDHEAAAVVAYFSALDRKEIPFVHIERAALSDASIEAGKLLMSRDYFDCFSCHQRGAEKPQGPPEGWAPDLALAHARLDPDWIVDWIRDPQKLMPGTKMPSYYPGGPPDVLGGDEEAQMRALRDYIISLGMPAAPASPAQMAGVAAAERPNL
jgi:mono/diheme cytochrome c family protein